MKKFHGDKTAWLFVEDQQILKAEYIEGVQSHLVTVVNLDVGANATLQVPLNMTVAGTKAVLSGKVTFLNLFVESGGEIVLNPTSFTATFSSGSYQPTSSPGSYTLSMLILKRGSNFSPADGLNLEVVSMHMKRYVKLYANYVQLSVGYLMIEREAELNVAGRALVADAPASGQGRDKSGGAYASSGGVGSSFTTDDAPEAYGTIYKPLIVGTRGGDGGYGASTIKISTVDFDLYGLLSANGNSSSTGGGGSGGSIYVVCLKTIQGLGEMNVDGGAATGNDGGGGSGGRIAVEALTDSFSAAGTFSAKGGNSPAPHGKGGPGSIYLQTGSATAGTIVGALRIDNSNGQEDYYMTLDETIVDLDFDNLYIFNYSKLQIASDTCINKTININKVHGDGTGLVRLKSCQKGTLERLSSGNSKLEINLELHDGGEFVLSETTTILGKASTALDLDGIMRGVLNLILGPGRHMRMGSNARIVPIQATVLSSLAKVTFTLLQLDPGSTLECDPNTGLDMLVGTVNVKYRSSIKADYFNISSSSINIELEALLSSASGDRTLSTTIDTTTGDASEVSGRKGGAGHGGVGGGAADVAGDSYGSLYRPTESGSRARSTAGKGGGKIYIKVGTMIYNDGLMTVSGSSGTDGGGSGGSIWIVTVETDGYGIFASVGGDGDGTSGAGSGGRISINCSTVIGFEGNFNAYGGAGFTDSDAGGAGTVYLEDIRSFQPYRRLLLDNKNRPIDKYSTIDEVGMTEYNFDEVHLLNKASLHVRDTGTSTRMDIRKLVGDRSGLLHVHRNQFLVAEFEEAVRKAFTSGVNLIVDEDGEIQLPGISYIYGRGINLLDAYPEDRSVQIFGTFTGVLDLILGFETLMYLGPTARTALLTNGAYTYKDNGGNIRFGTTDARGYSFMKYAPNISMNATLGKMDVRYKAVVSAESIFVAISILNVEAGARLTTSAVDRPLDTLDEVLGSGSFNANLGMATGGGHASVGGGFYDGSKQVIQAGGDYYNSLYIPKMRGSAGGNTSRCTSGSGGGIIDLKVSSSLLVDGDIASDGSPGDSSCGGGSGGSVYIESSTLEGHGVVSVQGGAGRTGGAGGRTAFYIDTEIYFFGLQNSTGGEGDGSYMADGGPGSVFIQDIRYKRPYKQLYLDNSQRTWDHYLILDEVGITTYEFNDVHMYRNVSLQIKEDSTVTKTLTINKIYGDKTSRIHVKTNQTAHLEEDQSLTKTLFNLWVDAGAKVFLSQLVYIMGLGEVAFFWSGEIIGVQHLRIVPGRAITIGPMAQTSSYISGVYTAGIPGWFVFGSLELGSGAVMELPPPVGLKLTVSKMVSCIMALQAYNVNDKLPSVGQVDFRHCVGHLELCFELK